jgi:hypothetical protein
MDGRKPLDEHEVVIHVPKGIGKYVKIEEEEAGKLTSEIVVQVSSKRRPGPTPVLGVIVK